MGVPKLDHLPPRRKEQKGPGQNPIDESDPPWTLRCDVFVFRSPAGQQEEASCRQGEARPLCIHPRLFAGSVERIAEGSIVSAIQALAGSSPCRSLV